MKSPKYVVLLAAIAVLLWQAAAPVKAAPVPGDPPAELRLVLPDTSRSSMSTFPACCPGNCRASWPS